MRVLLIDGEPGVADRLERALMRPWPQATVATARTGAAGLSLLQHDEFDLVVLEVELPDCDGRQVCQALREWSSIPIVFVTDRSDQSDRVLGLEVGADDYLVKPWEERELLARIQAVLRRSRRSDGPGFVADVAFGRLQISFARREVRVDGRGVRLTATEYRLLSHLIQNAGRVLTHRLLLARVWGDEYVHKTGYLKVHMQRLRRKLGDDPRAPRMIATERGIGYRFLRPSDSG